MRSFPLSQNWDQPCKQPFEFARGGLDKLTAPPQAPEAVDIECFLNGVDITGMWVPDQSLQLRGPYLPAARFILTDSAALPEAWQTMQLRLLHADGISMMHCAAMLTVDCSHASPRTSNCAKHGPGTSAGSESAQHSHGGRP